MPTTPNAVTSALMASSGGLIGGPNWAALTVGIGLGFSQWVLSGGVLLTGAAVGGFGPVVGTTIIVPPTVPAVMFGMNTALLLGPTAAEVATAVTFGISSYCATTGYAGAIVAGVPGGPAGVDTSKVMVANSSSLTGFLVSGFASAGLVGPSAGLLAAGLGLGIGTLMLGGVGSGVIVAGGVGGATSSVMI